MIEIETIFQKTIVDATWDSGDMLKLPNRAMNFGDGLFETMVMDKGEIRFLKLHVQRLMRGLQVLDLDQEAIDVADLVAFLKRMYPTEKKRVRWNIFRAGSGKYTPSNTNVVQTLQISEFSAPPTVKYKVDVSHKIRLFPTLWSSFKSLNALPYVLANQERQERGLDEIILLDSRGYISEAGASNIFWLKGDTVYTPALSCSCINGISRQVILDHLYHNNLPYVEGEFLISELENAESVFVSNCTGISYLESFKDKKFSFKKLPFLKLIFD